MKRTGWIVAAALVLLAGWAAYTAAQQGMGGQPGMQGMPGMMMGGQGGQMPMPAAQMEAMMKANSGQIFKFGSQPGILVKTPAGEVRAFSAVCTHLACTVQYREDMQMIWCACHNGHYDLFGKNIAGPPPRPLEPYTVNFRAEQIVVTKGAST